MKNCLIIEDNPSTRKVIDVLVRKTFSCATELFQDPVPALDFLKSCSVDLIIFDYYMPFLNGEDFLRALNYSGKCRDVAKICVTACTSRDVHARLLSLGARAVLLKPVRPNDLRARITNAMVRTRASK